MSWSAMFRELSKTTLNFKTYGKTYWVILFWQTQVFSKWRSFLKNKSLKVEKHRKCCFQSNFARIFISIINYKVQRYY